MGELGLMVFSVGFAALAEGSVTLRLDVAVSSWVAAKGDLARFFGRPLTLCSKVKARRSFLICVRTCFRRAEAGLYSLQEMQKLQVVSYLAMDSTPLLVHSWA